MKSRAKIWGYLVFFMIFPGILQAQGTSFFGEEPPPPPKRQAVTLPPRPPTTRPLPAPVMAPPPSLPTPISVSDVILLMDVSGSMEAQAQGQSMSKMEAAQKALDYLAQNMNEGTRFQLWTFSDSIKPKPNSPQAQKTSTQTVFESIGPFGSPVRQHLQTVIRGLQPEGGTNLYQAVYQAIDYFHSSAYHPPSDGQARYQVVVVLSDGQDDNKTPITLTQVQELKEKYPAIDVKTIGFGISPRDPFHQVLCQLSRRDQCSLTNSSDELQKIIRSFTKS